MRKYFLMVLMLMTALFVNAQKKGDYLACTGNNVNVRTGPGLKYSVQTHYGDEKIQLMKGYGVGDGYVECEHETGNCVLMYEGKRENGFMLVSYMGEGTNIQGWVSAQYLRKVCPWCEGYPKTYDDCDKETPRLLKVCKHCKGRGY